MRVISFDTDTHQLFDNGNEKELTNYKFIYSEQMNHNSGWSWNRPVRLIEIFHKSNGSWRSLGKFKTHYFDSYYFSYEESAAYTQQMISSGLPFEHIVGVRKELDKYYASLRRKRNKELAAERKKRDEAQAAALGISVEDLRFERKKKRVAKQVEATTEKMKKQMELNFKYMELIQKLEKELSRCRKVLETHEIHRLKLRNSPWNVNDTINRCIHTLQNHINLEEEEEK